MPENRQTAGPVAPEPELPRFQPLRTLLPGVALTALGTGAAFGAHLVLPAVSALMAALVLGAVVANTGLLRPSAQPGVRATSKTPLRAGIVLLGLQLAVADVLALGLPVLGVIVVTVFCTFFGTVVLARWLGLGTERGVLVAAGTAICGASAVAAMRGVVDSEEEDVMTAVALVTLFGTVTVFALPVLHGGGAMDDAGFGMWAGASVHEVGQVVAAAGAVGSTALASAVVVKLTRVLLLAPMIVGVGLWRRTRTRTTAGPRPPIVPLFVVGFLGAVALGSLDVLPAPVLDAAALAQTILLSAGLFALGTAVRIVPLVRTGGRSIVLGAGATLIVTTVAGVGIVLVT
ncbi:putative sulfate exporter family transporter [Spiractinospora alimapuensis]|uniref:YeiH family protein n=1 Tax=Spiractinospora alimapuensis TaxID=2820884 RepID=UPI001F442DE9|nr:putative sulfate exporter family transporter [Spiractinospora alimapuensis]QVQ53290.1 putative sulfate exporter family transporter [Spiractinospora alimapuensis]